MSIVLGVNRLFRVASATYDWLFSAFGLTGTPWNDLNPGRTGLGTRIDSAGLVGYGPHNLLLNSATLATQNITTVAGPYTLKFSGAGTVTLSGTGSGALSAGTNTFTATAGTLTLTVAGSVTSAQLNVGAVATDYVPTTTAARYLPRLTYNPSTLAAGGMLIGNQGTNLALWSRDLSNAAWVKTSCSAALTATGADGVANSASTLTASGANATCLQSITSASAARITSAYVKRRTGAGVVEMTQDNGATWTAVTVTASWALVSIPSATVTNPILGFRVVTSGDAIDVDYVQHELGAVVTSSIPTTTAAVTRVADWTGPGVVLTGAALAAAFPAGVTQPFTGVFKYRKAYSAASDETAWALSAGTTFATTNGLALQTNGTQAKLTTSAGDGTATGTLVHDGSTVNRIAVSVDPTYRGSALFSSYDFTTWASLGAVTGKTADSFTTSGAGGVNLVNIMTIGKTYEFTIVGSTTATACNVRNPSSGTGLQALPTGSFSLTWLVTWASDDDLYVQNASAGVTTITELSVKEAGKMSISVNGAAAVETTGIGYTGSGTTSLIPGSQTTGGSEPVTQMEIADWNNAVSGSYITGAALAALSA